MYSTLSSMNMLSERFLKKLVPLFTCEMCRRLTTASSLKSQSSNNLVRRFLIEGNQSRKRKKYHYPRMMNPSDVVNPQTKGERNSHRLQVLNKVFLEKICDILSTGEVSPLFTGHGIEISKVKVLSDMSGINVHWYCTGSALDDTVEKILKENSYALRYELSKQRVIGRVPPITFVRDDRYYKLMEVDKLLAVADYGEDFEPTDSTHQIKFHKVLQTQFDNKLKEALMEAENEDNNEDYFLRAIRLQSLQIAGNELSLEDLPLDIPQMRNDILSVNTDKIFKYVKQGVARSRAEHRKHGEDSSDTSTFQLHENTSDHKGVSRTEEIRQWASRYDHFQKKGRYKRYKEPNVTSFYPEPKENEFENEMYQEEEDFLDENFEQ